VKEWSKKGNFLEQQELFRKQWEAEIQLKEAQWKREAEDKFRREQEEKQQQLEKDRLELEQLKAQTLELQKNFKNLIVNKKKKNKKIMNGSKLLRDKKYQRHN